MAMPTVFFDRFTIGDGCWQWTGRVDSDGYGRTSTGGHNFAHRLSYEIFIGPIPKGLTLDHLCRNRACVNPTHLEPVSMRVNALRGMGWAAIHARQTHCRQGHPFDQANTRPSVNRYGFPVRDCRACSSAASRRYRARMKTAVMAGMP
jgi:hypothetical protein